MKIYTRTGDHGETGLRAGQRVAKDTPRLEACGTVDEFNAVLGLVRAEPLSEDVDRLIERLQNDLFEVGAELANDGHPRLGPQHVKAIEETIDRCDEELAPLAAFILPAGTRAAAALHLARTVCRRAERRLVTLDRESDSQISPHLIAYFNRLSDLLFTLARLANRNAGLDETAWQDQEKA